jgi:uncharacterized protein (DUF4213/DUF364 family)
MLDPKIMNNGLDPRRQLEDFESTLAGSMERLVNGKAFASLIGMAAENAVSLSRINAEVWDLVLRNLRIAGRADVDRLGRRLNRIDDKLEMVLQEIERLDDPRSARR